MHELVLLMTILSFVSKGMPFSEEEEQVQLISVDQGANFTLPCGSAKVGDGVSVMWVFDDRRRTYPSYRIQRDGSIYFANMKTTDAGVYSCRLETSSISAGDPYEARVRIRVRTPPLALKNVTVTPFSISAVVSWEVGKDADNGGYPIRNFQIAYRLKSETERDWKTCLPAFIDPHIREYSIYHLQPNSTYLIKVWANNQLGSGAGMIVETITKNDPQEIELSKHFLEGVDSFDVRIWIIAVGIVVTTLLVLGVATCCLFYKEYTMHLAAEARADMDGESIELMPNIILNPGYDFQSMEITEPDENSNDTTAMRVNNNSVIFPSRV